MAPQTVPEVMSNLDCLISLQTALQMASVLHDTCHVDVVRISVYTHCLKP
jgi:hypothetical protein